MTFVAPRLDAIEGEVLTLETSYPARKVLGDITGTAVPAGCIGEKIAGTINSSGAMTSTTTYDMATISLTPGVWMIYGMARASTTGTPGANSLSSVSISAATASADLAYTSFVPVASISGGGILTNAVPRYQLVTATTTYYLTCRLDFITSTHARSASTFYAVRVG